MTRRPSQSRLLLTVTHEAQAQILNMIERRQSNQTKGIRVSIKSRGCSGLAYSLTFVDEVNPLDERIDFKDFSIFIDSSAILYLVGTEMTYEETPFQKGFMFKNPNEKGKCGCGESFHV